LAVIVAVTAFSTSDNSVNDTTFAALPDGRGSFVSGRRNT
jgi:hypothetical protein